MVFGETACLKKPIVLAVGSNNKWLLSEVSNPSGAFEFKANQDGTCLCEFEGDQVVSINILFFFFLWTWLKKQLILVIPTTGK